MYLHLGNDCVIPDTDVIGIFDLERASLGKDTRAFLANATATGTVVTVACEMPKAFVITPSTLYVTSVASSTLLKRGIKGHSFWGTAPDPAGGLLCPLSLCFAKPVTPSPEIRSLDCK